MGTVQNQAAALRAGILGGYVSVGDAVRWADDLIAADRIGEVPQALDLALLRPDDVADAVTLLGAVRGDADAVAVGREAGRLIYERLASGRMDAVAAARAMYRVLREELAPDAEFEVMAYSFDDAADLAFRGTWGTTEGLRDEMLAFLRRYASDTSHAGIAPA